LSVVTNPRGMKESTEVTMASTFDEDKPWKTDLAQRAAQRREAVAKEIEASIKKAPSFEDSLRLAAELMKKRFARFTAVTIYVADGEDLAIFASLERPQGPDRINSGTGPLAEAAQGNVPVVIGNLHSSAPWASVGLTAGSAMVAPVRTEAGLWAIVEVWSDFRDAFGPQDARVLARIAAALAHKTPAA
jgi:putative methionine-R-sulfoxide reductase with GAF domain